MAELKDLYPDIRIEVDGCPVSVMDRAIRQTLRGFCRETWYWLHPVEPLTLQPFVAAAPSTYLYELDTPEDAEVIAVDELVKEGRVLPMRSDAWLDERVPGWREQAGDPQYYLMLTTKTVRFVPASDRVAPMAITGRMVLMPTKQAVTFGDVLMDYSDALAEGVLSRLLQMNKPWANGPRAQSALNRYVDAVSDAKAKVMQRFNTEVETICQRSWI